MVKKIERVGDGMVMATDFGAAVLDEHGTLRRFIVDVMTNGALRVTEAVVGN